LELQMPGWEDPKGGYACLLRTTGAAIHACNCRFLVNHHGTCLLVVRSLQIEVRNCELIRKPGTHHAALNLQETEGQQLVLENSILAGGHEGLRFHPRKTTRKVQATLRGNTFTSTVPVSVWYVEKEPPVENDRATPALNLEVARNILDGPNSLHLEQRYSVSDPPLDAGQAEALLTRMVRWHDRANLYPPRRNMVTYAVNRKWLESPRPITSLDEWKQLWNMAALDSLQQKVAFLGGDIAARLAKDPERITAADFRLSAFSPGKKAGPGGRDLGADLDLVGPGPAYERWRQTPEYRQWRERTKLIKEASATK
jgi:hypothetical protein